MLKGEGRKGWRSELHHYLTGLDRFATPDSQRIVPEAKAHAELARALVWAPWQPGERERVREDMDLIAAAHPVRALNPSEARRDEARFRRGLSGPQGRPATCTPHVRYM